MKKIATIPFTQLQSIPVLIKDFLNGKIEGAENVIFSLDNIRKQIEQKQKFFSDENRNVLKKVLKKQYQGIQLSEKQKDQLEILGNDNTFTVTTGHQLNLFTGPVFFIYKILQTIKLANFLNSQLPDYKVVPLFWMATEDHDFEEINHFKTHEKFYETKAQAGNAVGRMLVEDHFFINEFQAEFGDTVFGTELIQLMKLAYREGNSFAEATRILAQELFANYGLLLIDGDDPELKAEMNDVFKEELFQQKLFKTTENEVERLKENYGKVQVNPREINLFYLSETRNRIELSGEQFHIVDSDLFFSANEMLNELQQHPERFSPNALMRPVYQETVLPNLAYIGGNAEVMYWLELRNYFDDLDLPFPILIPRNSMLYLNQKTLEKAHKLGVSVKDLFRNFADVSKDILLENNAILSYLDQEENALIDRFRQLSEMAKRTDHSFGNLVNAEEARQLNSFKRMRKRLLRAEKIKQREKLERMENLFLSVHPGKIWQERVINFSVFYSDFGAEWLQNCYDEMDVENSNLIIVSI